MNGIEGRSSSEWLLSSFLAKQSRLKVESPIGYEESKFGINIGLGGVDLVRDSWICQTYMWDT